MNNHYISKLISIIILIFPALFIVNSVIADTVLTTQVTGSYYYSCTGNGFNGCTGHESIGSSSNINVCNVSGSGMGITFYNHNKGLIEFDISSIKSLYERGNLNAKLALTGSIIQGTVDVYSMIDGNENGVLQLQDATITEGYIGSLGNGDINTIKIIDITDALEHDLFDADQTDFSGFILDTPMTDEYSGYVACYSFSNPQLIISKTTLITLSSFTATPKAGKVTLQWGTETEIDNAGFNLYRSETEDGNYTKINSSLIPAQGSSTQGANYEFIDYGLKNGKTYYYKLEDIDLNGTSTMHGPVKATPRLIYGIGK